MYNTTSIHALDIEFKLPFCSYTPIYMSRYFREVFLNTIFFRSEYTTIHPIASWFIEEGL